MCYWPMADTSCTIDDMDDPNQQVVYVRDAAKYLGVAESTVRNMIKDGRLSVIRLGRRVFIEKATIFSAASAKRSRKEPK